MAKNWAVCIGINEYQYMQSLEYAVRDAEQMSSWLKAQGTFEKVYLFTDNSPPIADMTREFPSQPNYTTLLRWMGKRFPKRNKPLLTPGDNLWFFFSGHGCRYGDRDYLLLSDSDSSSEHITSTAISIDYITERLRNCGAGNIILLIDACRDSAKKGLGLQLTNQQGIVSISSCSPDELSYEIKELEHGSFTYALLESLQIQGEGNCATVERLCNRLRNRVREINQQHKKSKQTPYEVIQPASKYHLILLPSQATLQDVAALKVEAYKAEDEDIELAEKLWTQVLVASPADPDALAKLKKIWLENMKWQHKSNIKQLKENHQSQIQQLGNQLEQQLEQERSQAANQLQEIQVNYQKEKAELESQIKQLEQQLAEMRSQNKEESEQKQQEKEELEKSIQLLESQIKQLEQELSEVRSQTEVEQNEIMCLREQLVERKSSLGITLKNFNFEVLTVNERGEEVRREKGQAEYFNEDLGNGINLEMVSIQGGKFLMGTEEGEIERLVKKFDREYFRCEKPQHEVTVTSFFMGKYQVTQAQWKAVAALPKVKRDLKATPSRFKGEQLPVEQINWYDAEEFCARLAKKTGKEYRLPSEAEWEYACRAETTTPFHFGEAITGDLANYAATNTYAEESPGKYRKKTTEVGSFSPNGFGLYDMHGNVWEWCRDNWHDSYEGAPTDGNAWTTGGDDERSPLRGGAWFFVPNLCRSAYRNDNIGGRDLIDDLFGIRVVWSSGRTQ